MSPRLLVMPLMFLALSACPALENPTPDDAGTPDAGVMPDAGEPLDGGDGVDAGAPDGGVLLDLRLVRGAPYVTRAIAEHPGAAPFALTRSGYALELGCDAGACDFEFRALDGGALLARRTQLRSLFGTSVSRDGKLASLFEAPVPSSCTQADGAVISLWKGAWHLLDLATGETRAQLDDHVTPEYFDPAFLSSNHHARLMPIDPARCDFAPLLLRDARAPYAAPPVEPRLGTDSFLLDELGDGRLINLRVAGGLQRVEVMDPFVPSADVLVTGDSDEVRVTAGFVHATTRYPAQRFSTFDLAQGRLVHTDLPFTERTSLLFSASGRFVAFCDTARPVAACDVRDGLGESAPFTFQVAQAFGRLQLALAGRAGFVTWVKGEQVWRRSLGDGHEDMVHPSAAQLRTVGDGRAVLAIDATSVVAIDADRVYLFEGRPVAVLDGGALGGPADLRQAGTVLVITASPSGGAHWLHAWHVPSGRIARLTDSLLFNPPFQAPLSSAARCEAPGFVRSAGRPADSGRVDARLLHFTEFVPGVEPKLRLFVMPVELDAAPRLIAEVPPDACGTPLSDTDASVVWLPVPMPTPTGGVRAVMARP